MTHGIVSTDVVIVTPHFYPEEFIINDVVKSLLGVDRVKLHVITAQPSYPSIDSYERGGFFHESFSTGKSFVRRSFVWRRDGSRKSVILNYLSFIILGSLSAIWLARVVNQPKILVFQTSPVTSIIPALVLKLFAKGKLSCWVQDIWPYSIQAFGVSSNSHLYACLTVLSKALYRSCDHVFVSSQGSLPKLVDLGVCSSRVEWVPNWSWNTQETLSPKVDKSKLVEATCENKFVIAYAGNFGSAQDLLGFVQDYLSVLRKSGCKLMLIGSGNQFSSVRAFVEENHADDVLQVLERRTPGELSEILGTVDACFLRLVKGIGVDDTLPSKFQFYLNFGKPLICSDHPECSRLIRDFDVGLSFLTKEEFIRGISRLRDMSEFEKCQMQDRLYRMKSEIFSRDRGMKAIQQWIDS